MSQKKLALAFCLLVAGPSLTLAENNSLSILPRGRIILAQTHAGQMDTDGILSPGEVRNPRIDYDKSQRRAEHHGDERVENPYNDDAAADARDDKRYQNDREYRDWYDRRSDEGRRYRKD